MTPAAAWALAVVIGGALALFVGWVVWMAVSDVSYWYRDRQRDLNRRRWRD